MRKKEMLKGLICLLLLILLTLIFYGTFLEGSTYNEEEYKNQEIAISNRSWYQIGFIDGVAKQMSNPMNITNIQTKILLDWEQEGWEMRQNNSDTSIN